MQKQPDNELIHTKIYLSL